MSSEKHRQLSTWAEMSQGRRGLNRRPRGRLTSMHAEVTVVLVQGLQGGDVRGSFDYLIHPLDGTHHFITFFLSEDRRTFMLGNLSCKRRRTTILIIKGTGGLTSVVNGFLPEALVWLHSSQFESLLMYLLCPVKLPRCNDIIFPAINYGKRRQSLINVTWIR